MQGCRRWCCRCCRRCRCSCHARLVLRGATSCFRPGTACCTRRGCAVVCKPVVLCQAYESNLWCHFHSGNMQQGGPPLRDSNTCRHIGSTTNTMVTCVTFDGVSLLLLATSAFTNAWQPDSELSLTLRAQPECCCALTCGSGAWHRRCWHALAGGEGGIYEAGCAQGRRGPQHMRRPHTVGRCSISRKQRHTHTHTCQQHCLNVSSLH